MPRSLVRPLAAALAALACTGRAAAAAPPRTSPLVVAEAEQEGVVVVYATTDPGAAKPLLDDFAAVYPRVKVEYHHIYSSALYDRFLREARGGRSADVLWSSAMDLQMKLANDGYASEYRSPETEHLPAWSFWRDEAYGTTFEPLVFTYATSLLRPEEVPRSHRELARLLRDHPERFRGRVASYDPERSGVGCLLLTNDARSDPAFEDTVRAYGAARVKLYRSTIDVLDGIASGEHLIGFNAIASYALERQRQGAAIGIVYPEDYTLVLSRIAIIPKVAPHPGAAKVFLDYLLSARGQEVAANASGLGSVRADVPGELTAARLSTRLGARLRPIAVGPKLLVYLDQANRAAFLRRWRRLLDGK